jgi:hypothetical protein
MNLLRLTLLLQLAMPVAFGQDAPTSKTVSPPNEPKELVWSLYEQVIARHPDGIPEDADWKIFAPYLSKGLQHRIDLAKACSDDRDRKSSDSPVIAGPVSAFGLFSGDESAPQTFRIEKTESEKDGSVRVYVSLKVEKPPQRPWAWPVAAVVIRDGSHFAVEDVIYIDDHIYDREADRRDERLSEFLSAGCDGAQWGRDNLPNEPEAFVRSLYEQVVARHPIGIPNGADWKVFALYLDKALLHKIDLGLACGDDFYRQHPDPNLKPAIGWLELGTFSGGDEELELRTFEIERAESQGDGSFRVDVTLTWGYPPESPWTSRVAIAGVRENGHLAVDDVIYFGDTSSEDGRLSEALSVGCDGPHWVGSDEQRGDPKR